MPTTAHMRRRIPRNVIALGWVSFFTDLASEMLYPIIPLFLTGTLGVSPAIVGVIEGIAEGISSGLRWIGGVLSDRFQRRKPFVVWGYSLSALSKPLMGAAPFLGGWPVFLLGRSSDRFGKSVRTAARDALIADSADPAMRGSAFGFHRAMDTAGAVGGPLIALGVITLRPDSPLALLFFIALIPGLASVLIAAMVVREVRPASPSRTHEPGAAETWAAPEYPRAFWLLLGAVGIFALGNSSDAFLLLRAKELGLSTSQVILAFALYNAIYALGAWPLGGLSDRIGRKPVIAAGWAVYAAVYLGFAAAGSSRAVWFLLPTYGLYQALTEGVTKAMIVDLVPAERRASAIGLVATVSAVGQLVASPIAGLLWTHTIPGTTLAAPFVVGAACAAVAALGVLSVKPKRSP